nr:MAG TPA: hypothetical protein [Microviridae sp.]
MKNMSKSDCILVLQLTAQVLSLQQQLGEVKRQNEILWRLI